MTDTRTRRDAAAAGVREHGDMLTEWQMLQRGSNLIRLLHAGAERPTTDEYDHVPFTDSLLLDCFDSFVLSQEDSCGAALPIDAILTHYAGIYGSGFDHRTFRRKISV